jgi:hypothetical protein
MARTTTHTTSAAPNGCVPTQQPTPAPCPTWCDEHYTAGDDDAATVVHEGGTTSVETTDAEFTIRPVFYKNRDCATTEITFDIREDRDCDLPANSMLLGMTIPEAQHLITALVWAVNLTLPLEQQTFLGPPGMEYVRYDDCDYCGLEP